MTLLPSAALTTGALPLEVLRDSLLAYAAGDRETLKPLLTPTVMAAFAWRHASRIASWLRQLMSRSVNGSRIESMWLTCPARLKIRCCPRRR